MNIKPIKPVNGYYQQRRIFKEKQAQEGKEFDINEYSKYWKNLDNDFKDKLQTQYLADIEKWKQDIIEWENKNKKDNNNTTTNKKIKKSKIISEQNDDNIPQIDIQKPKKSQKQSKKSQNQSKKTKDILTQSTQPIKPKKELINQSQSNTIQNKMQLDNIDPDSDQEYQEEDNQLLKVNLFKRNSQQPSIYQFFKPSEKKNKGKYDDDLYQILSDIKNNMQNQFVRTSNQLQEITVPGYSLSVQQNTNWEFNYLQADDILKNNISYNLITKGYGMSCKQGYIKFEQIINTNTDQQISQETICEINCEDSNQELVIKENYFKDQFISNFLMFQSKYSDTLQHINQQVNLINTNNLIYQDICKATKQQFLKFLQSNYPPQYE